jgi:hypothetical protein
VEISDGWRFTFCIINLYEVKVEAANSWKKVWEVGIRMKAVGIVYKFREDIT